MGGGVSGNHMIPAPPSTLVPHISATRPQPISRRDNRQGTRYRRFATKPRLRRVGETFFRDQLRRARKPHRGRGQPTALQVNALGARNLAIASASVGATLLHLSTDDLFPVTSEHPFNEFDPTDPPHVYGKSKLAGERFVCELNRRHIIVRSSWVYTAEPDDILPRALKASREGRTVYVPANQFACPTSADTFAKAVVAVMESNEFGTFHAACTGVTSRFEFFERAFELVGEPIGNLRGASKPEHGYRIELDNMMARLTGVFEMPTWEDDLAAFVACHDLTAGDEK